MKYFDTKQDSLEEAISKAINEDNIPSAKELEEAGGKYLKYSDLLLQKGRMMAKGKNTAMIDKEISKEMKKLGIKEKLDPVGKADGDIDNDGDKDDSDKYLAKRRKAISKAIAKDKKEDVDLEETTTKDVDETLDKIREANVAKGKSMRSILADIWKMNEGKSPFDKEEGFKSDAQRKAAFASGYKEKGKKKEEVEKSSKTATGKKATKVEIEPEIK
tara:strand:+ start:48 stop:698 length:651 start_codon:yes stop_codon:yes gene_type:complete